MKRDSQLLSWTSAARTDIGLVRSRNEDACLARPERGLWVVADGMGGHAFGDVASRTIVEAMDRLDPAPNMEQFIADARAMIHQVNQDLRADAQARRVPVMGSTVVVLLAFGAQAACLWAGDSRIYLFRKGRLHQLTQDHSQPDSNMITRAVGAAESVELDLGTLAARDGDMFLLCSDGLSNPVPDEEIAGALACGEPGQAADELITLARANGGRDNITAVVVRADDTADDKTMLNPAL
ncbi:PP2C family protein-serine/threonine phosphatase [Pseudoduganella sp. UC29_106]|uniref:PP2C family protein-serine/threonine phosphatase n=1 Tax=Pseudoduganella sp. UC29_106 TaxID=3374553 RepID=UPI00375681E5